MLNFAFGETVRFKNWKLTFQNNPGKSKIRGLVEILTPAIIEKEKPLSYMIILHTTYRDGRFSRRF